MIVPSHQVTQSKHLIPSGWRRDVRPSALPQTWVPIGDAVGLVPLALRWCGGGGRGGSRRRRIFHLAVRVLNFIRTESQVPHFAPQQQY